MTTMTIASHRRLRNATTAPLDAGVLVCDIGLPTGVRRTVAVEPHRAPRGPMPRAWPVLRSGCSAPRSCERADVGTPWLQVPRRLVRGAELVALELGAHAGVVGVGLLRDELRPEPVGGGASARPRPRARRHRERPAPLSPAPHRVLHGDARDPQGRGQRPVRRTVEASCWIIRAPGASGVAPVRNSPAASSTTAVPSSSARNVAPAGAVSSSSVVAATCTEPSSAGVCVATPARSSGWIVRLTDPVVRVLGAGKVGVGDAVGDAVSDGDGTLTPCGEHAARPPPSARVARSSTSRFRARPAWRRPPRPPSCGGGAPGAPRPGRGPSRTPARAARRRSAVR